MVEMSIKQSIQRVVVTCFGLYSVAKLCYAGNFIQGIPFALGYRRFVL